MTITIGNTDCHLLLDFGSGCTIINMSLAKEIMFNCAQSQWSEKKPLELKSFSYDIVETLGTLKTPFRCNYWKIQKAKITVVADGFRPILGRDLFDQFGITISQTTCTNIEINNIETLCAIKNHWQTILRNSSQEQENRNIIQLIQSFTEIIVSRTKMGEKYQSIFTKSKN